MKKWRLLSFGMVALHLIHPACLLAAYLLDVEFVLYSPLAYAIVVTALFVAAGILRLVKKDTATGWDLLLIPVVLVSSFCLLAEAGYIYLLFMLIDLVCAVILTLRWEGFEKVMVMGLCIPALIYLLYITPGLVILSAQEQGEVIFQVNSPSGEYTAQVLETDVWLLEPETKVTVVNNRYVPVLFGEFRHKPQRLYHGEHQEYETIQVTWVDEDTLCINGKYYDI